MASTKYTVFAGGEEVGTKSKKAQAIELATEKRDELKVAVEVKTGAGNVVFEQAAPKKIKMSPRYSRRVELPEGIEAPEGTRVAYKRPRRGLAVLHRADGEEGEQYSLLNLKTGEELEDRFPTTRAAGDAMSNA